MSTIPYMADSALAALQRGSAQYERGAAALVAGTTSTPAAQTDQVDVRGGAAGSADPVISGVGDMMLGRMQILAGAYLLHAYSENRRTLYDMLKP